ncbi:tripartite tricarboxylate transporter TctB family protein [Bradyrhizobium sp. INPA01-394B]|uniref:Tripartite tricarboxylate transporter TctB family protein n=1 Tax=Bradyrhizobium campsiandrae TaxID=1729892 RepID=A0ABR7U7Z4_9BRAD|nr:tripartite tricarboxylate transporter TctB family protein [Bradyrhizobium campsiandrae]MBC9878960.1 tripartite tricarboxylate transporter TctB family protein [Bradyrhizobium campsiandrae]MBC9979693.1 tripartite tricarboxylate transporter TctB family protein [Bradyrhizobium campsiandrae]
MADTMGHSAATATRNTSVALGFCLLAVAPQIFEFIWSIGTVFGWGAGRGPATVLISHATALVAGAPAALLGAIGGETKKASSDVLLALIYSYPLFAVAIVTLFMTIKSAQDYIGGVILMALALFALWASSDLQGMRGFSFGAGTAPRMFGGLLVALSAGIALTGLLNEGPALAHYAWRGPLFVMCAILFFALAIRPLGLVVSAFVSFMIAALGSHETRWLEAAIVGICLTIGCALLFPYVLGLPMPMFPRFLAQ